MKKNAAKSISILALTATIILTGCSKNSKKEEVHSSVSHSSSYSDTILDNHDDVTIEDLVDTIEVDSQKDVDADTEVETPSVATEDSKLEHCENENYDNQVAFCNDLMTMLKGENKDFEYFKSDEDAYQFYSDHLLESYYLYYLNRKVDMPDIVTELNNLYVLSQVPSCVDEEYWNFIFAHLTKTMQGNSLYEEYIDLSTFIHDNSLSKDMKLTLKN